MRDRGEVDLSNPGEVGPPPDRGQLSLGDMQKQAQDHTPQRKGSKPLSAQTAAAVAQVAEYNAKLKAEGQHPSQGGKPPVPAEAPQAEPASEAQPSPGVPDLKDPEDATSPALAKPADPVDADLDNFSIPDSNPYNKPEIRKRIEDRCNDMSVDDLLGAGEVRQVVPIRKEGFTVEFRSYSAGEETFLKEMLGAAGRKAGINRQSLTTYSVQFIDSMYQIYNLALSLVKFNGRLLPDHLDDKGEVDMDKFEAKVKFVKSLSQFVAGFLMTNCQWFMERAQKLVTEENIKNG